MLVLGSVRTSFYEAVDVLSHRRSRLQLFNVLDPVLTMAAALTVQSPFVMRGNFDSTARIAAGAVSLEGGLTQCPANRRAMNSTRLMGMPSHC